MELVEGEAGSQCGPKHQSDEEPPGPLLLIAPYHEQRVIHVGLGSVLIPVMHRLGGPCQQRTRPAPGERGSAEPERDAPVGIVGALGVPDHCKAPLLFSNPEVEESVGDVNREQLDLLSRARSGPQSEDVLNCVQGAREHYALVAVCGSVDAGSSHVHHEPHLEGAIWLGLNQRSDFRADGAGPPCNHLLPGPNPLQVALLHQTPQLLPAFFGVLHVTCVVGVHVPRRPAGEELIGCQLRVRGPGFGEDSPSLDFLRHSQGGFPPEPTGHVRLWVAGGLHHFP